MLGERRSKSAFYAGSGESVREEMLSEEQASGQVPEPDGCSPKDVKFGEDTDGSPGDRTKRPEPSETEPLQEVSREDDEYHPPRRPARPLRTHDLFFSSGEESREFSDVLREVQGYLSKEYSSLVTAEGSGEAKSQIRRFAGKYIQDHRIVVTGMTMDELIDAIYSEMAEFGFLTKYIYGEGIEEIDVNAWDDVEVQFSGGVTKKLDEHFDSPEHAINVVRRMLHVSGMVLDDASPSVLGHLSKISGLPC